jgi:acylphosphatase
MANFRAIIKGRVQGVGFRFFVQDLANEYDVKGTVRNLANGNVEVQAEGEEEVLQDFLKELKKGPPLAMVSKVDTEWSNEDKGFYGFRITY